MADNISNDNPDRIGTLDQARLASTPYASANLAQQAYQTQANAIAKLAKGRAAGIGLGMFGSKLKAAA